MTLARFVVGHERALPDLISEVLRLCDQAGLVAPEPIATDGTRMAGDASQEASRDFTQIAMEMLAEHEATDEAEDEELGEARGDELPEQLRRRRAGASSPAKRRTRSVARREPRWRRTPSRGYPRVVGAGGDVRAGGIRCRHLQWPRGRRLKWPHLASVVVGVDLA